MKLNLWREYLISEAEIFTQPLALQGPVFDSFCCVSPPSADSLGVCLLMQLRHTEVAERAADLPLLMWL